jgi:hypothetical protein
MKKAKFNIIDFLIIAMVVLVIFAGVYILGNKSETVVSSDKTKVLVTIEELSVDETTMNFYKDNVKKGDNVIIGIREKTTGVLEDIKIIPATDNYDNPVTGKKEVLEKAERYNLTFTFETELSETETDFLIGTDKIKIGKELNFSAKGYSGYGNVVIIKKVGGEE